MGGLLFQLHDLARSIVDRRQFQWFYADGVSHILFLSVLAAMMLLWAPNSRSKHIAYKEDHDPDAKGKASRWNVDEDSDDGDDKSDEDDSFWSATVHGVDKDGVDGEAENPS